MARPAARSGRVRTPAHGGASLDRGLLLAGRPCECSARTVRSTQRESSCGGGGLQGV